MTLVPLALPNMFPDLRYPGKGKFIDIMPGVRPAKMDVVEEEIRNAMEIGSPSIVFTPQVPSLWQYHEAFGGHVLNGEVSMAQRAERDENFRLGGGTMIASPAVWDITVR